jgi:hypothetical protein
VSLLGSETPETQAQNGRKTRLKIRAPNKPNSGTKDALQIAHFQQIFRGLALASGALPK